MTRKDWPGLIPSLLVGVGIIVSTLVAVRAAAAGWPVLAGPLLLAVTVVGADLLNRRLQGESPRPSWAALCLGGAVLLASLILGDPGLVKTFIPILGAIGWTVLLPSRESRYKRCRYL